MLDVWWQETFAHIIDSCLFILKCHIHFHSLLLRGFSRVTKYIHRIHSMLHVGLFNAVWESYTPKTDDLSLSHQASAGGSEQYLFTWLSRYILSGVDHSAVPKKLMLKLYLETSGLYQILSDGVLWRKYYNLPLPWMNKHFDMLEIDCNNNMWNIINMLTKSFI